jgi:hypothetical protein
VLDEAGAKVAESALREGRLCRAESVEHHLPAQVDDAELDGFGVRDAVIGLQEHDHREQRGWFRVLACA